MSSKKIVLISTDEKSFEIDEKVALKFVTISHMMDNDCVDKPIPLDNHICIGKILELVIEYAKNICDQDDKIAAESTEAEDLDDHVEKAKEVDEKGKGKEVAEDLDHVEKAKEVDDHVEKGKGKEVAVDLDNVEEGKEVIWDATDFMNKLDLDTVFKVLLAANYLNFQSLLDLCCQTVADRIKDFQPEEIRVLFNIQNDFTPEEEAEIRKENAWSFEEIKTTTASDDSDTSEGGGSDIAKEGDSKTTEGGGSDTAKEGDSKTTEAGGSDNTKEDASETTEGGGSDTTKEGDSKTTEAGGSNTTKEDGSKTTEEVSKAQEE